MNIIDIADYQKSIPVENESAPLPGALTEEEIDHINELLEYFRNIEDKHSAFKIFCAMTSMLSHELLCSSGDPLSDPFMVPLNDNHSL